ncbi:hypothetical protein A2379_05260 [Candidatus Amesbacteria bacterium RIFOXYB1_FULL_47_13]|nr:MAG: hypothetical protein A2379_05260 [Candidatus Amesbacteria bacterium RIFOXYB1_FULL_47_13]
MRIGFAYNVKHDQGQGMKRELDFDSPETIEAIIKTIEGLGHRTERMEADSRAFEKLNDLRDKIDLVFNIAEGLSGDARESQIPLFCEMLKIPYTHSSPTTHAIKLRKNLTKLVVTGVGVKVPGSMLAQAGDVVKLPRGWDWPVIIKPNTEGSSIGVFDKNVVDNQEELNARIGDMYAGGFEGQLLVEEFLDGREFTVAVMGNRELQVLPIIEQKFDFLPQGMRKIAGFELKWLYEDTLTDVSQACDCPAKIDPGLETEINETAKLVYRTLEVRDCARIDFRMNSRGELYFLEINTLPGINPDEKVISYFPLAARTAGMDFPALVKRIIDLASERYGIK